MTLSNVWPLVFSERSLVVKLEPVHRVQFLLYAASPLSSVSFKHHHHTVIHSREPELGLTLGACQHDLLQQKPELSLTLGACQYDSHREAQVAVYRLSSHSHVFFISTSSIYINSTCMERLWFVNYIVMFDNCLLIVSTFSLEITETEKYTMFNL